MTETEPACSLEAISGPLKGQIFELRGEHLTIGREPSNDIPVPDSSVSRRHCELRRESGGIRLVDLESRNGTYLNGQPATEHVLSDGDQIKAGNCLFRFRFANAGGLSDSVYIDAGQPLGEQTVILRREDAVYLRPHEGDHRLPSDERTVRDLDALFQFSQAVGTIREVDHLIQKTLDVLIAVAPADRIVIILSADGESGFASAASWDRTAGRRAAVTVSRTIITRVLDDGVAVLSNDIAGDADLQSAQSLLIRRVRSVLAVPMAVFDKVIGLIYLDGSDPQAAFDDPLLQLMTAMGNIAALAIENARHLEWIEGENRRLQNELNVEHDMVGESAAMREVYQFISKVAGSNSTVLVTGESGTGKELVARAVHRNSPRTSKPFIAVNCGAFVETLLESELFGHEKGAFTGASAQKRGKLEIAEGGTVFLDEIGELALSLQVKLLRVLQEREFQRVGGNRTLRLDIRLIAATNRDLKAEVRAGRFREDLFYRLDVVSIRMPALRDRREDIATLASYFAVRAGEKQGRRITGISPKARACLMRYDWPGNVRELENAIERAVVLGSGDLILPDDLPDSLLEQAAPDDQPLSSFHEAVAEAKRQIILRAIDQCDGNYTEAAKALGIHPNHFFRLIKTLNLKPKRQKA